MAYISENRKSTSNQAEWYLRMKLKRIEITGFKSFVDKTVLTFDDPISAIVGPNGCGKSNVVDAIRWVMGEMSAKQLRGRALEDVIFAGSETRHPVGLAQVNLTFTNEGQTAPDQYNKYAEITVTRRLYRSGESEYLINKVPVRLKDILELFMDTGVGRRTYSIIEQGQISQILNSKPEDRRQLIEEAAGITKYKTRKEEALRKVASTRNDLIRVGDTVAEIKRSLNSLNRAAKKAERYHRFKDELKAIDLVLGAVDFQKYSEALEKVTGTLEELRDQEKKAQEILDTADHEREEIQLQALEKEGEVEKWQEQLHLLDSGIQQLQSRLALLVRDMENNVSRKKRYTLEIEDYRGKIAEYTDEVKQATERRQDCEQLAADEERELAGKAELLERIRSEHNELFRNIEVQKNDLIDVLTAIASARKDLDSLADRREEIGYRRSKAGEEAALLTTKVQNFGGDLQKMKAGLTQKESDLAELTDQQAQKTQRLVQLKEDNKNKKERYETLREVLSDRRVRLSSIKEMVQNLEGFGKGVKNVLLGREESQSFNGIHGVVADYIRTEPRYETALEAVLGDRLQTVLVEDQAQSVSAIEYLKNESEGRSNFIPVSSPRLMACPEFPEHTLSEAIAPMADVVSCSEPYESVVKHLLANVLLVEDLDKAIRIHKANGYTGSLVTLDGEVIEADGFMSGGSQESLQSGILQKRRQVRELEEEVAGLEQEHKLAEDAYLKGEGLVYSLEERIAAFEKQIRQTELELVNRRTSVERLEEEIGRSNREIESLRSQEAELVAELQRHQAREQENSGLIGELETKRQTLAAAVSGREQEAGDLTRQIEDLGRLVTEARIGIAGFREKAEGLRQTIAQMDRSRQQMEQLIVQREQEIGQLSQEAQKIEKSAQDLRQEEAERVQERNQHKEGLDRVKREHEGMIELVRETDRLVRSRRREAENLREAEHAQELSLQELRMKRDHLESEIRERYEIELSHHYLDFLNGQLVIAGRKALSNDDDIETDEQEDEQDDQVGLIDDLPPTLMADNEQFDPAKLKERQKHLRQKIEAMGEINPTAVEEYAEQKERFDFYQTQMTDLEEAIQKLESAIKRINQTSRKRFQETFDVVNEKFQTLVPLLFIGGRGELRLVGEGDVLEQGLDIVIRPVGKKLQSMTLMSGGEKALAAIALICAIFLHKPTPFALLDEVDAPLDDQNITRYTQLVERMSKDSQFILITHNKSTMAIADTLYGITMEEPGVSKLVSVHFDESQKVPA